MNGTKKFRRGLTLLELLVVLFIISIMLAVAIPIFRPPLQAKAIREGARSLSQAFGTARTKARQTGNSWGLMFEPLPSTVQGSLVAFYVEVPPPYSGGTYNARLRLLDAAYHGQSTDGKPVIEFDYAVTVGSSLMDNVSQGDLVQLNYQDQFFRVEAPPGASSLRLSGDFIVTEDSKLVYPRLTALIDDTAYAPDYAFQFFRQPVKTSLTPIQISGNAVVDLSVSGIGDGVFQPNVNQPIIVTLDPTGQLDTVYHPNRPEGERPVAAVHFLVGKPGRFGTENLLDLENIWVSVGNQTGLVTSAENACVDINADGECDTADPTTTPGNAEIRAARKYARTGQSIGG